MKSIALSFIFILLLGCSEHPDLNDKDIGQIELDAVSILESKVIILAKLPKSINSLKPESVVIRNDGLYITLGSSFVTEKGLFIPVNRVADHTSIGTDPEYKRLSGNVYSYIIRG